jgi:hypothetical protein
MGSSYGKEILEWVEKISYFPLPFSLPLHLYPVSSAPSLRRCAREAYHVSRASRNFLRLRARLGDKSACTRLDDMNRGLVRQGPLGTIKHQYQQEAGKEDNVSQSGVGVADGNETTLGKFTPYKTTDAYCLCQTPCQGPRCARGGVLERREERIYGVGKR